MMQIVRCESAVAQGLRSEIFQATKMAESARMQSHAPFFPFGLFVVDLSLHKSSLAPKCTQISDIIGF